jgi:hypothetical protein
MMENFTAVYARVIKDNPHFGRVVEELLQRHVRAVKDHSFK